MDESLTNLIDVLARQLGAAGLGLDQGILVHVLVLPERGSLGEEVS